MPSNLKNALHDVGKLKIGIFHYSSNCVELVGDQSIPYLDERWLEKDGGTYSADLTSGQIEGLSQSPLVLAQIVQSGKGSASICEIPGIDRSYRQCSNTSTRNPLFHPA